MFFNAPVKLEAQAASGDDVEPVDENLTPPPSGGRARLNSNANPRDGELDPANKEGKAQAKRRGRRRKRQKLAKAAPVQSAEQPATTTSQGEVNPDPFEVFKPTLAGKLDPGSAMKRRKKKQRLRKVRVAMCSSSG